jgi:hypothetical protein
VEDVADMVDMRVINQKYMNAAGKSWVGGARDRSAGI